jgi:putative Mg2+ transporter-C (MgtC) family protein
MTVEAVARIAAAVAFGALVGAEREATDQPAGLRTHITVCLGACLFGAISTLGFEEFDGKRSEHLLQADVTRVASQVVVGIGFLGAGVIFREGATVRNLTTAASLWVTAAVGVACGVGDLGLALIATIALIVSLVVLRVPRRWIRRSVAHDKERICVVTSSLETADEVVALLPTLNIEVERAALRKLDDDQYMIDLALRSAPGDDLEQAIDRLVRRPDLVRVASYDEGVVSGVAGD